MIVTFTRTAKRRYRVSVEGPGLEASFKEPAPGYHDRLPHDAAHFIVENELGIIGGVFGQIAAGGTAGTFFSPDARKPRKAKVRGARMANASKEDALFSEHAIYAAQSRWERHDIIPDTAIPNADIQRIIVKFEEFAVKWSKLPIGGSITLDWSPRKAQRRKR